jgi:hypothetical protein
MAELPKEVTVGVVTKLMKHVGYAVFTKEGDLYSYSTFPSLERAKELADHPVWELEVKAVYVEEM